MGGVGGRTVQTRVRVLRQALYNAQQTEQTLAGGGARGVRGLRGAGAIWELIAFVSGLSIIYQARLRIMRTGRGTLDTRDRGF